MAKQQTGTIYTLSDPRDSRIRYVGQTKQDPLVRLAGHLASPSNPAMRVWIHTLALQGTPPRIDVIATHPLDRLDAEEQRQIKEHTRAGHRLLNAPHYHQNLADLYQAAVPAPAALKRDDVVAAKVDEYAHRVYGGIAAASAAGKLTQAQAGVRVLCWAPAVMFVFVWHTVLTLAPVRWVAKIAFFGWALWIVGFNRLAHDKVLPLLPLREAADFWHAYLAQPLAHITLVYLGVAAVMSLAAYSSVRESAGPRRRRPPARKPSAPDAVDHAAAAAMALDARAKQQK